MIEQRVAVGIGAYDRVGCNRAAAAALIVMTMDWPSSLAIWSAAMRAVTSIPPPGGNGTYILIGRAGKSDWALAEGAKTQVMPTIHSAIRLFTSFLMAFTFFQWGSAHGRTAAVLVGDCHYRRRVRAGKPQRWMVGMLFCRVP